LHAEAISDVAGPLTKRKIDCIQSIYGTSQQPGMPYNVEKTAEQVKKTGNSTKPV